MKKDIFQFSTYRAYLLAYIDAQEKGGRGMRLAMANGIGCPVSHISQVLLEKTHLTMEQAEALNLFLAHGVDESEFFLLLVQKDRAGTPALRERCKSQMQKILDRRANLKERLGVNRTVQEKDQAQYYSTWLYGAVHVMLSVPEFQSKEAIARHLKISPVKVTEILEFLFSVGLAKTNADGRLQIGETHIHLGIDSPLISKMHSNWRVRAIQALDSEEAKKELHYSSVVSLSRTDARIIQEMLIKHIAAVKSVIKESKEEAVYCFAADFFKI
jgi:uncharacterized protein (TIGR02147 family)